jgi:hypothetical protein
MERRTVYAVTVVALLAIAGGWAFAATFVDQTPPAQNSTVTVVAPNGATEVVQSTQLITDSSALNGELTVAGVQPGGTSGLNSTAQTNAPLPQCSGLTCSGYFSAVAATDPLTSGDAALQVTITAPQGAVATGFDVQVEVIYTSTTSATVDVFGSGYFNTLTTLDTGQTSSVSVFLYIDLGTAATLPPTVTDIVVNVNSCTSATTCP